MASLSLMGGHAPASDSAGGVEFVVPEKCQMCPASMVDWSYEQKQEHYETHFAEPNQGPTTLPETISNKSQPKSVSFLTFDDRLWLSTYSSSPPSNQHPGFIHLLKKALITSHERGNTHCAKLCHSSTVHISAKKMDKLWGCGYRCYMMSCSALFTQQIQPTYASLLGSDAQPGIRELQHVIETAWSHGFDQLGAEQLKHKLVGTNKWIGAADISVAFSYKKIPSKLVDFYCKKKGSRLIIDWIKEYFDDKKSSDEQVSAISCTNRMPLILQHQGHSRVVIGYEVGAESTYLLIFDPSRSPPGYLHKAGIAMHKAHQNEHPVAHHHHHTGARKFFKSVTKVVAGYKRSNSDETNELPTPKRSKSYPNDDDVIIVGESSSQPLSNTPEKYEVPSAKVLKFFRWNVKHLAEKHEYQILYFPMSSPLTDEQQRDTKRVTSLRIG